MKQSLTPYIEDTLRQVYGEKWREKAQKSLTGGYARQRAWDLQALLIIMNGHWKPAFQERLGYEGRNLINELRTARNAWAHQAFEPADTYRLLDTAARLLNAIGDEANAQRVRQEAVALMQLQFQQPAPAPASPSTPDQPPTEAATTDTAPVAEQAKPDAIAESETANEAEETEAPDAEQEAETPDEGPRESTADTVRSWFGRLFHKADEQDLEPLELRTRLLDKIEHALRRFRSERPLSINRITVHILAPASGDRLTYDAALNELDPPFDTGHAPALHQAHQGLQEGRLACAVGADDRENPAALDLEADVGERAKLAVVGGKTRDPQKRSVILRRQDRHGELPMR